MGNPWRQFLRLMPASVRWAVLHPFWFGQSLATCRPIHSPFFIKDGRSNFVEISLQFWNYRFPILRASGFDCLHMGTVTEVLSVHASLPGTIFPGALWALYSVIGRSFIHPPYPVIFILNNNDIGNGIKGCSPFLGCLFQLFSASFRSRDIHKLPTAAVSLRRYRGHSFQPQRISRFFRD